MEMFLMVAAMSLLGVVVSMLAFAAATHQPGASDAEDRRPAERPARATPGFFGDDETNGRTLDVPLEALLLQIERHVRLEQAAAEAFHEMPTPESLHSRTTSPLVH